MINLPVIEPALFFCKMEASWFRLQPCAKTTEEDECPSLPDDTDWVHVEEYDEHHILEQCWRQLPLSVPFEEFKASMEQLKTKHNSSSFSKLYQNLFWILHAGWIASGYVTTAITASQYVTYFRYLHTSVLLKLVRWMLT